MWAHTGRDHWPRSLESGVQIPVSIEFYDLWQHAPPGSENMRFLPAFLTTASPEGMCGRVGIQRRDHVDGEGFRWVEEAWQLASGHLVQLRKGSFAATQVEKGQTGQRRGGGSSLWLEEEAGLVSGSKQPHQLSGLGPLGTSLWGGISDGVLATCVGGDGPPSHSCLLLFFLFNFFKFV